MGVAGVIVRILLRVFAGVLIGWSLPPDWANEIVNDPAVIVTAESMVGAVIWGATEVYYVVARRLGWST